MRLFAALPIPDPAQAAIVSLLAELRRSDWPVRWVRAEGIHLTLKFYGEVAPERLDVIEEAVRFAVAGPDRFPCASASWGLPDGGPPARALDRTRCAGLAGAAPGPA